MTLLNVRMVIYPMHAVGMFSGPLQRLARGYRGRSEPFEERVRLATTELALGLALDVFLNRLEKSFLRRGPVPVLLAYIRSVMDVLGYQRETSVRGSASCPALLLLA